MGQRWLKNSIEEKQTNKQNTEKEKEEGDVERNK